MMRKTEEIKCDRIKNNLICDASFIDRKQNTFNHLPYWSKSNSFNATG